MRNPRSWRSFTWLGLGRGLVARLTSAIQETLQPSQLSLWLMRKPE